MKGLRLVQDRTSARQPLTIAQSLTILRTTKGRTSEQRERRPTTTSRQLVGRRPGAPGLVPPCGSANRRKSATNPSRLGPEGAKLRRRSTLRAVLPPIPAFVDRATIRLCRWTLRGFAGGGLATCRFATDWFAADWSPYRRFAVSILSR